MGWTGRKEYREVRNRRGDEARHRETEDSGCDEFSVVWLD